MTRFIMIYEVKEANLSQSSDQNEMGRRSGDCLTFLQ